MLKSTNIQDTGGVCLLSPHHKVRRCHWCVYWKSFWEICVYLDREQSIFFNFYLLYQGEFALSLAMIKFVPVCLCVCVCVCVAGRSKKKQMKKPGAGPNKSVDRLRHVGEHGCQRADVNRARVHEAHWMEDCYVYVTRCSGLACLTPIWNRVDRKVDRCFSSVHYLWDWGDPHCISQVSAPATVGRVLTLHSARVSSKTSAHTFLLPCVCSGGWWVGGWMHGPTFFCMFAHMYKCAYEFVFAYPIPCTPDASNNSTYLFKSDPWPLECR